MAEDLLPAAGSLEVRGAAPADEVRVDTVWPGRAVANATPSAAAPAAPAAAMRRVRRDSRQSSASRA
ncbi:MAG TPA: hypothetical protein VKV35_13620, partial [Streptosporangiaceae bacterium]|nr:hypothetical protein [Streptosporangiaceae bacterium]